MCSCSWSRSLGLCRSRCSYRENLHNHRYLFERDKRERQDRPYSIAKISWRHDSRSYSKRLRQYTQRGSRSLPLATKSSSKLKVLCSYAGIVNHGNVFIRCLLEWMSIDFRITAQLLAGKIWEQMYKRSEKPEVWRKYIIRLQLPISHCVPLNPGVQLQLKPFTRSVQVPLFLQGWLAQ